MAEMSIIWLRVAAGLYSLGLLHAILTIIQRRANLFRVALGALTLAGIFHLVSIAEQGIALEPAGGHGPSFPATG